MSAPVVRDACTNSVPATALTEHSTRIGRGNESHNVPLPLMGRGQGWGEPAAGWHVRWHASSAEKPECNGKHGRAGTPHP